MSLPRAFASDNTGPVHPRVLEMLAEVNHGHEPAYGEDQYSERVRQWFVKQFGEGTSAYLVWNGTGANVVALRAITRPYQSILCSEHAHVNLDECGAPELMTGCKVVGLPSTDGKISAAQVRAKIRRIGDEHAVQPRVVSLAQTTEYATLYRPEEIKAISDVAHEAGMVVFMDGARIANAAAALNLSVRAFTRDVGVDILSFGGSKNGAMGAEAVVVLNPAYASEMKFLRKQSTQLISKGRYVAAQFLALAENDLWLTNARQANAMARRLAAGVRGISGVRITQSVDASAVFAVLPKAVTTKLQETFHFYVWDERIDEVRWMTTWATSEADVDELVAAVRMSSSLK